jgi:antitoxin component YwqK of YwqJK toxin-antitoxin module
MRNATFFIAACAIACSASAIIRCEVNGQSVNPDNGNTTAGLSGMMRCKEESTGQLQREQELRNGKYLGLQRFYDRDGKLARERTVNEQGNTQGIAKEFWPNGQLKQESAHVNGSSQGPARSYFENSKLQSAHFVGERSTQASVSFDAEGRLEELSCHTSSLLPEDRKPCGFDGKVQTNTYRSGKRRAVHTFEQGTLLASTTYRDDGLVDTDYAMQNGARWHRTYDSKGVQNGKNVLRAEKLFEPTDDKKYRLTQNGGPLQWSKQWGANEQLIEHIRYSKGNPAAVERWYLNGAIKEKIVTVAVADGNPFGALGVRNLHESYDDNGRITSRENYLGTGNYRAQRVGLQQYFHTNGKLASEDIYSLVDERSRSRLVARKEWDDTGKLLADDEILEDGSHKRR